MKTGSLNYFQFDEGNEIFYYQDMQFWRNIPSDVKFYPVKCDDRGIEIVGDGYGILDKHNLPGKYGNGSIHISRKDVPDDVFEWCQNKVFKTFNG